MKLRGSLSLASGVDTSSLAAHLGRSPISRRGPMNVLRLIAAGFLLIGFVAGVRAYKADTYNEKIVGSWEVTKSEEPPPPVGAVVTFGKDGKMKVTRKQDGQDVTLEGTYAVEG